MRRGEERQGDIDKEKREEWLEDTSFIFMPEGEPHRTEPTTHETVSCWNDFFSPEKKNPSSPSDLKSKKQQKRRGVFNEKKG